MRFIDIALSSLVETEYLMQFAVDIGHIEKNEVHDSAILLSEIEKLILGLKKSKKGNSIASRL